MKKIVAVFTCFSAFSANAITNIESQRLNPIINGLSGEVELKIDGKSGNSEEEDYGLSARINHKQGKNLVFLIASKDYGTSNNQKDTDNSFAHGRWVHSFSKAISGEAFAQYQDDEFTRLVSRYLVGGGIRYTLSETDQQNIVLGAGGFYVQEKEDLNTYETDNDYLRLNSYASYKQQINDQVNIVATTYFQPRASQPSDYNILLNASLYAKLSKQLKLRLALSSRHDSEPPTNLKTDPVIDVETTDTEYSMSFVYEF